MPRPGELTYYDALGDVGREHALHKPFADAGRGLNLMEIGAVLSLLPPPPARVLDCGCGPGWLTHLLQKCGYRATGVDVAPAAIDLARANDVFGVPTTAQFRVADVEALPFVGAFDAVIFFESLHHALDERAALASAYRALRAGGVCIASEPGVGHGRKSTAIADRWDVTEKDMPPKHIARLGKAIGFRRVVIYPRADDLGRLLFDPSWPAAPWLRRLLSVRPLRYLASLWLMLYHKRNKGITVLFK